MTKKVAAMGYAAFVTGSNAVPAKTTIGDLDVYAHTSGQTGPCYLRDEQGRIARFTTSDGARLAALRAKHPNQSFGVTPCARLSHSEAFVDTR